MAQWKRAGPITQRSVDRNYALLKILLISWPPDRKIRFSSKKYLMEITISFLSVVVITSALHAEGRRFEPGRKHCFSFACLQIDNYTTSK